MAESFFNIFLEHLKKQILGVIWPLTLFAGYRLYKAYKRTQVTKIVSKEQISKNKDNETESSSGSESSWITDEKPYKLVLVVRKDLKMGQGKVAAQCAHAAVAAYKQARKHLAVLKAWENNGQTKIALKCSSETELMTLHETAKAVGLLSYVVCDAGQTQIPRGSKTVCSIGPASAELIDEVTGHLSLY